MAKRYGHIRPEVQRQALVAVATPEIQTAVGDVIRVCKKRDGVGLLCEQQISGKGAYTHNASEEYHAAV